MMALNISLCKHEYFMAAVFLSVIIFFALDIRVVLLTLI